MRTGSDTEINAFTFVHGPGLDDPIMGRSPGLPYKVYFMTDGDGGFISAGRPDGSDATDDQRYTAWGGVYNGTTGQPMTFDAARGDIDSLGFFRNRFYDQRTGRWTQEDPSGVAGGLNLYAFNGNNPVALRDPFGLCPEEVGGDGKTDSVDDCPEEVVSAWEKERIVVNPGTNWEDVDPDLKSAVIRTSMDLRKTFYIYAGKEEDHSQEGRHSEGGAVDISRINGTKFNLMNNATAALLGDRIGAGVASRLPKGRLKMLYTPGSAVRFNRPMDDIQRRALIATHRSHVHVTVYP